MADELRVGFIGGGNMARAIADGLIKSNSVKPGNITASAITQETLATWQVRSPLILVFRFCTCPIENGNLYRWNIKRKSSNLLLAVIDVRCSAI